MGGFEHCQQHTWRLKMLDLHAQSGNVCVCGCLCCQVLFYDVVRILCVCIYDVWFLRVVCQECGVTWPEIVAVGATGAELRLSQMNGPSLSCYAPMCSPTVRRRSAMVVPAHHTICPTHRRRPFLWRYPLCHLAQVVSLPGFFTHSIKYTTNA